MPPSWDLSHHMESIAVSLKHFFRQDNTGVLPMSYSNILYLEMSSFAFVYFKPHVLRYDLHKLKIIPFCCVVQFWKTQTVLDRLPKSTRRAVLANPSFPTLLCYKSLGPFLGLWSHMRECHKGATVWRLLGFDSLTGHWLRWPHCHMHCRSLW